MSGHFCQTDLTLWIKSQVCFLYDKIKSDRSVGSDSYFEDYIGVGASL